MILGHVGRVKLHYVTALRAILDQFPLQPRQIRKKKSWRPKTNPVYYEKGVACVAGVKRERGRGNVGAAYARAQTSPSPSPFNTCHAGYLRNVEIQWPLS